MLAFYFNVIMFVSQNAYLVFPRYLMHKLLSETGENLFFYANVNVIFPC